MASIRHPLRTILLTGVASLTACSSAPTPKDIPPGTQFSTHILEDGTKLFTLKSQPPGLEGESMERMRAQQRQGRAGGNDCFPCEPGERGASGGGGGGGRTHASDLKIVATAMIAENRYCRDGFVVLEQFQQERARVLRGECRDSADASDRARFSH